MRDRSLVAVAEARGGRVIGSRDSRNSSDEKQLASLSYVALVLDYVVRIRGRGSTVPRYVLGTTMVGAVCGPKSPRAAQEMSREAGLERSKARRARVCLRDRFEISRLSRQQRRKGHNRRLGPCIGCSAEAPREQINAGICSSLIPNIDTKEK